MYLYLQVQGKQEYTDPVEDRSEGVTLRYALATYDEVGPVPIINPDE